jgi:UrcA family protein
MRAGFQWPSRILTGLIFYIGQVFVGKIQDFSKIPRAQPAFITPRRRSSPAAWMNFYTTWEMNMGNLTVSGPRGLIASVIFGALAASSSGSSAANTEMPSQTAKFGDLNLSTSAGATALYNRIVAAAKGACSYYWFKTDADEAGCVHNAIANAVVKVNQPALFLVYQRKNPTSLPPALASQDP